MKTEVRLEPGKSHGGRVAVGARRSSCFVSRSRSGCTRCCCRRRRGCFDQRAWRRTRGWRWCGGRGRMRSTRAARWGLNLGVVSRGGALPRDAEVRVQWSRDGRWDDTAADVAAWDGLTPDEVFAGGVATRWQLPPGRSGPGWLLARARRGENAWSAPAVAGVVDCVVGGSGDGGDGH